MTAVVKRHHGRIWFGEGANRWSVTDPHGEALADAAHRLRYDFEHATQSDAFTVLSALDCYRHLTTYDLGVEHIIRKLRLIWRALREVEIAE
jgi:hypothetical protein